MIETIRGPRAAGPPRGGKTTMNERDGIEPFEDGASSDRIEGFLVKIRDWLTRNDWTFENAEDASYIRTGVQGKHARFRIVLGVRGEGPTFLCFALYDFNVPSPRRPAAADLVNRINYTSLVGNFEMDFDDGELRYRVTFPLDGGELADDQVERCLVVAAMMADRFYPAWMSLIHAGLPPGAALDTIDAVN